MVPASSVAEISICSCVPSSGLIRGWNNRIVPTVKSCESYDYMFRRISKVHGAQTSTLAWDGWPLPSGLSNSTT
ncbi:MAG: hypothetical protein C0404_07785, partial [Verrucomicrobia bacterium]|nr:hypothetical protein [Verrucomicrobiota bacterium]